VPEPILTLDDLEPDRPTIGITRRVPDGWWQRVKHWALPAFPYLTVRYVTRRELYPLRLPSEFGLKRLSRLGAMRREAVELEKNVNDPGARDRLASLLREMTRMVLEAPPSVIDRLTPEQHVQVAAVFPVAVTGAIPTRRTTENPSTSAASSPASAASTAPTTG
jgi:hypothetical protein